MINQKSLKKLETDLACLANAMGSKKEFANPIYVIKEARSAVFTMKNTLSNYRYVHKLQRWVSSLMEKVENKELEVTDLYRGYLLNFPTSTKVEPKRQIVKEKVSVHLLKIIY